MKLYYEDEYIKLIQGDCLEVMDKMIEKGIKVDCSIVDIPYGNVSKCGEENFEFIILEDIPDDYKLQREQEYLDSLIGKEDEIYNICSDCQGGFAMSFRPRMRRCKVCRELFKTFDLREFTCSVQCEIEYENFKDEYDHPEDYRWRHSNYERKCINDWDVDDFTAADWDDRWSK